MKAERLDTRYYLTELCISELTGNGGCNNGVNLFLVFKHLNSIQNKGFIGNRAERALVNAGAAGNALTVINTRRLSLGHGNRADLAGFNAGTLEVHNRAVGADLRALTALNALGFINVRLLLAVKGYGSPAANVLTAVRKTTAARLGHFVTAHRALIAGYLNNFDNIGIFSIPAHCNFNPLA